FPFSAKEPPAILPFAPTGERVLVPMGGGKDSVVTLELLRHSGLHCTMLRMGPHPLIKKLAQKTDLPLLQIERTLSPALFTINAEGALNGHVPITAYLSILAIVVALLYEFRTVVMSNERSANVGSLLFHGKEVNHQWSKSLAFEHLFQEYLRTFITPDLQYFSLLRPWSELRIAHAFSHFPQYFDCTSSCNANWKITKQSLLRESGGAMKRLSEAKSASWCGQCPKCAFTFALYAAFLPKEKVLQIFQKNLFEDQALLQTYMALLGIEGVKPFECVGTPEETKAAFLLARERGEFNDTPAMQLFFERELPHITDTTKNIQAALDPTVDHAIPPAYSTVLSELPPGQ
ncbi:endonuclease domain-containing protein, partial [Candidatus Peregrinibacteria bacterium]|nr:endonuclease domain-containing protein [Candidatus Peregrinibacteria bacterium]